MPSSASSLIEAVRECNYSLVADFLQSGAFANERDKATGDGILTIAAQLGDARLVELLIDAGADPNSPSAASPLDVAAGCGHLKVVELLLDAEADIDAVDEDGGTALESAAAGGHRRIVSLLLEAGANPKRKDHDGKSAIIYAAERGHADIVAELMPLSTPKFRQQAVLILKLKIQGPPSPPILKFFADAQEGNLAGVRAYLDEGGNVDAMDLEGHTALGKAAAFNQIEVVKLLVERGANPKHLDASGTCPLEFALSSPAVFSFLFPLTPKTLRKSVELYAPLLAGMDNRMAELESKLAEQGAVDDTILSFLNSARDGKLSEVESYLKNGGRVDAMDDTGSTALFWAAHSGELDVVKFLVAAGANVNHMNKGQNFALLESGFWNKCFVYKYLQPLTEKVLRDFSDAFIKSRNVWWM